MKKFGKEHQSVLYNLQLIKRLGKEATCCEEEHTCRTQTENKNCYGGKYKSYLVKTSESEKNLPANSSTSHSTGGRYFGISISLKYDSMFHSIRWDYFHKICVPLHTGIPQYYFVGFQRISCLLSIS